MINYLPIVFVFCESIHGDHHHIHLLETNTKYIIIYFYSFEMCFCISCVSTIKEIVVPTTLKLHRRSFSLRPGLQLVARSINFELIRKEYRFPAEPHFRWLISEFPSKCDCAAWYINFRTALPFLFLHPRIAHFLGSLTQELLHSFNARLPESSLVEPDLLLQELGGIAVVSSSLQFPW